jgi:hypothetical protein
MAGKKVADKVLPLDEPYKVYSAFKGTQPGLSKRQMLSVMKSLQKMKPIKKEMGGEVMDTTKSMPVGMMDGGKVKPMKMKMGGVIPGRGGKFKGVM